MFNSRAAQASQGRYLLLLGADILMRERAVVSALRTYPGPLFGMRSAPADTNRYFDHELRANSTDAKSALAAVEEWERATGMRPEAVVPTLEMNVHVAVAIARHYQLPSIPDECLAATRDKHLMKVAFERAGVSCARHGLFATLDELRAVAAELGFPLVLKPRDFAGNVGTIKVNSAEELPEAYRYCRESLLAIAPEYNFSDGRYQAEQYVEHTHEISVEVFNLGAERKVLAVTDKAKLPAPYFTEIGQLVPSRESGNAAARDLAMRACAALSMDRGIAHVEILINGDELSVVEVAARPGGDGIMDLIDRVYGFSPYDLQIAAYRGTLDRIPELPSTPRGVGAIRFLKAPVGTVTAVQPGAPSYGPEELALYTTIARGDHSDPASSYLTRNGVLEYFIDGATAVDAPSIQQTVADLAAQRTDEVFTVAPD